MMMAKDNEERSILAAAAESGSTDVFQAVLSATGGYIKEEIRYGTMLVNPYLDT